MKIIRVIGLVCMAVGFIGWAVALFTHCTWTERQVFLNEPEWVILFALGFIAGGPWMKRRGTP